MGTQEQVFRDYREALNTLPERNPDSETVDAKAYVALNEVAQKHSLHYHQMKQIVYHFADIFRAFGGGLIPIQDQEEFLKASEEMAEQYAENIENNICPVCNNTEILVNKYTSLSPGDVGNEVVVREEPFQHEVHNILEPLVSCFVCWRLKYEEV